MNLSHRAFVGALCAAVVVLCTAGVALTADHSSRGPAGAHRGAAQGSYVDDGGYVDDKDDDSEDVARDLRMRCVVAERPGCPRS